MLLRLFTSAWSHSHSPEFSSCGSLIASISTLTMKQPARDCAHAFTSANKGLPLLRSLCFQTTVSLPRPTSVLPLRILDDFPSSTWHFPLPPRNLLPLLKILYLLSTDRTSPRCQNHRRCRSSRIFVFHHPGVECSKPRPAKKGSVLRYLASNLALLTSFSALYPQSFETGGPVAPGGISTPTTTTIRSHRLRRRNIQNL